MFTKNNLNKLNTLQIGKINIIHKWLKDNEIYLYTINDDFTINVHQSVFLGSHNDLFGYNDVAIPSYIQFNYIKGCFNISQNKLSSLRGSPYIVEGSFNCEQNMLKSFKFMPKKIGCECFLGGNLYTPRIDEIEQTTLIGFTGTSAFSNSPFNCMLFTSMDYVECEENWLRYMSRKDQHYNGLLSI